MWNPNVDWKKKYFELAALVERHLPTLNQHAFNLRLAQQQLELNLDQGKRLDLQERGKVKFLRLKEDCEVQVEYRGGEHLIPRQFKAGTLIEATLPNAQVYLDEDGDGFIYFPPLLLEEVELEWDQVNYDEVVTQG